jgi:hypothetical protein
MKSLLGSLRYAVRKNVNSFVLKWVGEKREQATTRAKEKCGDSSPFDFAQGQNDTPEGLAD